MNLTDMTWPQVKALPPGTPVVIPVAALEQHGRHLPVFTDSLLLGEVVRRVNERLADRVLFAPLMWLGNSDHHLDFGGTLSAAPRVYLDLLNGLAENFLMHGFQRIVFLNGHGGNVVPGRQSVFELRQRHRAHSTPGSSDRCAELAPRRLDARQLLQREDVAGEDGKRGSHVLLREIDASVAERELRQLDVRPGGGLGDAARSVERELHRGPRSGPVAA